MTLSLTKKLVIIAGTYSEALDWCKKYFCGDSQGWIYASSVYPLKGLRDYLFVRIGTWKDHPGVDDIDLEVEIARKMGHAREFSIK